MRRLVHRLSVRITKSLISWLALLALGLISACGDDGIIDAGTDSGPDVEDAIDITDAGAPDARDSSGPPAPWRHEPVITVQSSEPCEDWIPVERMPRGLPADATPRLLWRYRPADDPLYSNVVAALYSDVSEPVVSPDGTIWVRGPRAAHVTQLSRDGRMRRWFRSGGADENDPKIPYELGPLIPLPDGRVVAAVLSLDDRFAGTFTIMDPRPEFSPAASAESGARLMGIDYDTQLAVGPNGMVYATAGNKLYATCRGERLMWTLTNELIEPGVGDGRFFYLRVETDGSVTVSGGAQRTYQVDPAARAVHPAESVALADDEALLLLAQTPSVSLFNIYNRAADNLVVVTDDVQVRFDDVSSSAISPTGAIHFGVGLQPLALDPPYTGEPREISADAPFDNWVSWWFESGDWVRIKDGIVRSDSSGEEVWNVPVAADGEDAFLGGETRVLTMDETGVVFSSVLINGYPIELAAFQTDGLPPPLSVCVQEGCNAHRDRWVRPETPAE